MIEVKGFYNTAIIYSDDVDPAAIEQIKNLCNQEFTKGSKIRIMPDVHVGMGCTIGTTMTISDKVVPNLVGVDIGCGLEVVKLTNKRIDFKELDALIYATIPSGFKIRKTEHPYNDFINLNKLKCKKEVKLDRARLSIGTLGGGNHFIEVNKDSQGSLYLVVHSGSRHLGHEVASLYQKRASKGSRDPLAYLEKEEFENYIHDMKIIQEFASLNRKAIVEQIVASMKLQKADQFTTIHNYIETKQMILRKGAVSAQKNEKIIIPLNMRDGSLICIGKGNKEWNYSAPHGAGRVLSRREARRVLELQQYKKMMKDIFTTSVNKGTIDESPLAYKPFTQIVESIGDTVDVVERLVPLYNFKAAE